MSLTLLAATPFPLFLLLGAGSDLARYLIPNRFSVGLIGAFFVAFAFSGLGWAELSGHLLTALIALVFGFALFALGLWGAADGKFLPAALLWIGSSASIPAAVYISLLGALLSLLVLAVRRMARTWPILTLASPSLRRLAATDKPHAPYGAAIALGALLAFPQSELFKALAGLT
ncbi:A24 family peptidase [Neomegalonema perideroedes]|uniref:A24 family peptidase n=1 Tax=Neomegalonema perideroedes TaxID=217219 RepID=UPI0003781EC0|nr:prepilin peptidase [Neomegalonema perideroedes]